MLLGAFCGNITKAEEIKEEKIYCNATIEDDFTDNEVLVVLTNEESLEFNEYTINDFSEINCVSIEDLTDGYKDKIIEQLNGTYTGNMIVNLETFNRILKLILPINSKQNVLDAIDILEDRNDVISVEPNYIVEQEETETEVVSSPNDYYLSLQWGIENANIYEAWDICRGLTNIKIGIIDSGIDVTHEDLSGRVDTALSVSFSPIYDDPLEDETGHGTAVAGIIGASTHNEKGISGICWNTTLVSLKVLDVSEKGDWGFNIGYVVDAIEYADENDVMILNYSGGGDNHFPIVRNALENYRGLFICSAGNKCNNNDVKAHYPSEYSKTLNNVISVGASNEDNEMWISSNSDGSNYGQTSVDIFAPGEDIATTDLTNIYVYKTGTSYAAPFVTGVAALMMAYYPNMSVAEIKELIIESATKSSYWNDKCVAKGILNAYGALTIHQHVYGNEYEPHDMLQHWHYCYCGQRKLEAHTWELISSLQNYDISPNAAIGSRRCIYCGVLKLENNVINNIEEVLDIYE